MPTLRFSLPLFFIAITALHSLKSHAQSSVWGTSKNKLSAAPGKAKNTIRNWKDHVLNSKSDDNYKQEVALSGKLNSNGWTGGVTYFRNRPTNLKQTFWTLSFSEIKHEKQIKQQPKTSPYPELGKPGPYIFGKVNNLYALQLGFGKHLDILPAVVDNNLSVGLYYCGGLSIALIKPYYLKLISTDTTGANATVTDQKYSKAQHDWFLDKDNILGASTWKSGLDDTKIVPGLFFETAFTILPSQKKFFTQRVIIGINTAFYSKQLVIMANNSAYNWHTSVFAGLMLGKRW
jgi:hypothetical protein